MTNKINVLHFADIHIGMENYGHIDSGTGINSRVIDFLRRFDEVIDYGLSHDVDLVIFAGDAFKTRDPSPTLQREFARRVKRLVDAGVPIAMLVGNQWQVSPQRPDDWPTEIGRLDRSPGVLVPGEEWPGGHWFIFSQRRPVQPGLGCSVLLYNDETGYATRPDGPAVVD